MKRELAEILFMAALGSSLFFIGCERKTGTFEKAGERADEIKDNVKEGKPILHKKGTAEKVGEAVDEAFTPDKD